MTAAVADLGPLVTPTAHLVLPAAAPRPEWLAARQRGIGGSDVAAILGMDHYRGPLHVYREKRGEPTSPRNVRLERAARRGHRLEGLVAEFFSEETGHPVIEAPGTLQHADHPWMLANCDRLVLATSASTAGDVAGPLECKSRTWRSARREDWGGDEPPDGPALQAHWYLAVTGYSCAWVAGLIDDDLTWFRLDRDDDLIAHLVQIVGDFWHDHVLAGVEPDPGDLESTADLLAQAWDVRPEAVKLFTGPEVAEIDAQLERRRAAKEQIKDLEREVTGTENTLKAKLGDAEIAIAPGRELYSWKPNGTFAAKRFRDAEPDLDAAYTRPMPALDRERLAAEQPDIYRRFRARVFRPGGTR